jgi:exosortase H (IPTLxxWG-CTERM-specific)
MGKRREPNAPSDGPATVGRQRAGGRVPIVRFVLITTVALVGFFYLFQQPTVVRYVVDPYTEFVAAFARACLRLFGVEAGGQGSIISSPEFSVSIKNVCNGLEVTAIFLATVLGFPSSARAKLLGLALGYPVIFLINIARIMVLFVLGFKIPEIFDAVHYYYAQAFVIIATVAVWLLWVTLLSNYGAQAHRRVPD